MKPFFVVFFSSLGAFVGAVMGANGYGWRTWQFYAVLVLLCLVIWLTKRALDWANAPTKEQARRNKVLRDHFGSQKPPSQ